MSSDEVSISASLSFFLNIRRAKQDAYGQTSSKLLHYQGLVLVKGLKNMITLTFI